MATAFPDEDDLDGESPGFNQGMFKQALRDFRAAAVGLLGATGARDAAFAAFGILDPKGFYNLKPTFAVNAGALTMTLKDKAGDDLSADNQAFVSQRSSSLDDAGFNLRKLAANVALAVSSGATLGHSDGVAGLLYWYLLEKDASTPKVAVAGSYMGRTGLFSTTAMSNTADSSTVMYADEILSNKPGRLIAVTLDTQTTAGTWAALPTESHQGEESKTIEQSILAQLVNQTVIVPVPQSVRSCALDSNGYSALLAAGAALNFNVDASPTAAVLDFAAGTIDYSATISADASNQGSLVASNTNYIYADYVSTTSVTWANCLIPPQYGYAFDRTQAALLNFEGADASTTMIDDFGNTWTAVGNAQIDTAQFKFGTSSLLLDGTGDYLTNSEIVSLGDGSWEISCWVRWNTLPTAGNSQAIFAFSNSSAFGAQVAINNNAGTLRLLTYLSSNGSSHDLVNGGAGSSTSWSTGVWYKIRMVFDALGGTYRVYLSNNGAAETQDYTLSSSTRICGGLAPRIGAVVSSNHLNGWIDGFRFIRAATVTGTETPAAAAFTVASQPVHFYAIPAKTMYEVTAASASAGTNPTLTARNRLFVGEQDTNGSAVTATRSYAVRGQAIVTQETIATGTGYSLTHNLGVKPARVRPWLECKSPDNSFRPGDRIYDSINTNGVTNGVYTTSDRNILRALVGTTGIGGVPDRTTPVNAVTLTAAKWRYGCSLERGW